MPSPPTVERRATWRAAVGILIAAAACGTAGTAAAGTPPPPPGGDPAGPDGAPGARGLWLDRHSFAPGEPIVVRFTAPAGLPRNAWIGILPSRVPHGDETVNDRFDVDYEYLEGRTSGTVTLTAPAEPGPWDARMHGTDGGGRELASVSFTVVAGRPPAPAPGGGGPAKLRLERGSFAPNEEIVVHFTAPAGLPRDAWVGIVPAQVPHGDEALSDEFDVAYEYLEGRTSGTLVFRAPAQPGRWDVRMHDTDGGGRELTSVSFTVTPG